jgi:hypothetical protein
MARWRNRERVQPWRVTLHWLATVTQIVFALAAMTWLACGKTESSSPLAARASTETPVTFSAEHLRVAPAAFDLTFGAERGAIAWVDATDGGGLWLARLDGRGELLDQPERRPITGSAEEVSLVMAAAGPFVVWRERSGTGAFVRGLLAGTAGDVPLELGATWAAAGAERGNVALAVRQGGALALLRGPEEPCGDGSMEACFGFRFYQLSAAGAHETEFPLRVPSPCAAQAVQLMPGGGGLASPGARALPLQYAVCTRSEQLSVLTVFSIEPDRSYAAAHRIFEGCSPLGAGVFAGQASFVADCHGSRQLMRIRSSDAPPELHALDVRGLVCSPRGAELRLGEEWLALDHPLEQVELLLDSALSPPGARAVWTGEVLLVAQEHAGRLELERYRCVGSELRKLASPLSSG